MTANSPSDSVSPDENLARFILQGSHIRKIDNTVKPEAFVPHPYADLSVTRHLSLTPAEVWSVGEDISRQTGKSLHGRADTQANTYINQTLNVLPDPVPNNSNHAIVLGWPTDKPLQKMIAMEIAAKSVLVLAPR